MKIAVLMCGHIRTFCSDHIKSLYSNPENEIHIFVHTYTKRYGYHPWIKGTLNLSDEINNTPILESEIKQMIPESKVVVIEDELSEEDVQDLHMYPFLLDIYSQIRKIKLCNELRQKYERDNNIKYDLIFRTRPDVNHPDNILIQTPIEDNTIYVPECDCTLSPSDLCYMGSPSSMDYLIDKLSSKYKQYKFIYPSFPNRGLLQLLEMFPRIVEEYPTAHLDIFCDFKNEWLIEHYSDEISKIQDLLEEQKNNITNHGWVNGETLRTYWKDADIWFYPCIFQETCCLTAYEAAASKTLVVTNNLAALRESVGNRGVIVNGDPRDPKVQDEFIKSLFEVMIDSKRTENLILQNYEWVKTKSFDTVVEAFITSNLCI
jgi:hypothetical protein